MGFILNDMKILGSFDRKITGTILMFVGVLLMFALVRLPVITETFFGNIANLIIGIALLVIGLGIFTNPIIPKRQKREKIYEKSKHRFIEIFGLE